jgi:hypothetical protein
MRDPLENRLTMFRAVETLLDNNTAKTAGITVFATRFAEFKDVVLQIVEKEEQRTNATAGMTADKKAKRDDMVEDAAVLAAKLKALGSDTNDDRLIQMGDLKRSDLAKMRDTQLIPTVQGLVNIADANAASLIAYGVTAAMIAGLSTKMNSYNTALGSKESSFSVKGAAYTALNNLFDSADNILVNKLDNLMEGFKKDDNEFYNQYKIAREIHDIGVRHEKEEPTPSTPPVG